MTTYRLHCFKESGNSYKVALALAIAGVTWEKVAVDYFDGQTRQPGWRSETNEMGEVPVLEIDGRRMTQSGVILLHIAEQFDGLHVEASERNEVLRWLLFDNHKFTANLASYRWLRTFAKPAPHEAVLAYMRQCTVAALDIVDRHLADSTFIVGNRLTVADLSMVGYVYYPADELGFDLRAEYPRVGAWMDRVAQTTGWRGPYELLA
ncbi:glutathione binding-like protein [Variovorax sp. LjRoot175]|uniref:glutathione S-transferase family protein n=1 Tax=Variovorax sp. LjRoot175 TaxID=3342276 RepID=UPI003ECFEDE1